MRTSLLVSIVAVCALASFARGSVENGVEPRAGVVRIENTNAKIQEVGSGFIVQIRGNDVYVVTASHVVRGDQHPRVFFFNDRFTPLLGEVIDREDDDNKGLALVKVRVKQGASQLSVLSLVSATDFGKGEPVKIIGFPGTSLWTVDSRNVIRQEGRNLVLPGTIREGYSGGSVVFDQQAIGLVTDVTQSDGYATPSKDVVSYLNGILEDPIVLGPSPFSRNFILNGGFEEGLRHWGTGYIEGATPSTTTPFWISGGAYATGELDETQHHSGKQSFRITNKITAKPGHFAEMSQQIKNLKADTEYEVSLWLKAQNAQVRSLVLIFDARRKDRHEMPIGTYDWKQVTFRFKTAENPSADFRLSTENAGVIWIDDIAVVAIDASASLGPATSAVSSNSRELPSVTVVDSHVNKASLGQIILSLRVLEAEGKIRLDVHPATSDTSVNDIIGEKKPSLVIIHVHALTTEKATVGLIRETHQLSGNTKFLVYSEVFAFAGQGALWVDKLRRENRYSINGEWFPEYFVDQITTVGFPHSNDLTSEQKIEIRQQVTQLLSLN